jgi:uncharacterized small protein (DUF1192 family)
LLRPVNEDQFLACPPLDSQANSPDLQRMDLDDLLAKKPDDPLAQLLRQDLDPLSVEELHARQAALEAEIARIQGKLRSAVNVRANADALFKS